MVIHSLEKQKKYFEPSLSHAYFNLINEILTGQMNDDKVLLKKWKLLNLRVFPEVVMTAGFIYTQTEYFDLTKQLQMKTILSNVRQVTKYWDGAVDTPWYYERIVILLPSNGLTNLELKHNLTLIARKVINLLENNFDLQASVGIGNIYNQPSLLYRSFEEACQAQKSYLLFGNPIIFYEDLNAYQDEEAVYPFSEESELLTQIKKGNINEALNALDKLNRKFQSKNPEGVKEIYLAFYLELLVMISRALIFQGADPVLVTERKMSFLEMLKKIDHQQGYVVWSYNMLTLFMGMVNSAQFSSLTDCVRNAKYLQQISVIRLLSKRLRMRFMLIHHQPDFQKGAGINFVTCLTAKIENAIHRSPQENTRYPRIGFKDPVIFTMSQRIPSILLLIGIL